MKVNVEKNISEKYEDINILVNAPEDTKQVEDIINLITNISNDKKNIIGKRNDEKFILPIDKIICFYSENKNIFCRTEDGVYKTYEKLYELEESIGNHFIRISNSCIININYIKSFNSGITGTVEVIFKDNTKEYVSRRRISLVLKKLKEWGN